MSAYKRVTWLLGCGVLTVVASFVVKEALTLRAHRYLTTALDVIESHHVRRGEIDWASVRAEAYRQSADALTTGQTHATILFALARIGDHHSGLIEPDMAARLRHFTTADNPAPDGRLLADRIGYVRVPSFVGTSDVAIRDEAARIQNVIADVDRHDPCGWVVDLRWDGGGNMWPMLAGVGPILGDGVVGGVVTANGTVTTWSLVGGRILEGTRLRADASPAYQLQDPGPAVAVLVGHGTDSSGEAVAIAFVGRPKTRSFGLRSFGNATSNEQFPLSDGAVLNLSVSTFTDRNGGSYPNGVEPDVATSERGDDVPPVALDWIRQQGCSH